MIAKYSFLDETMTIYRSDDLDKKFPITVHRIYKWNTNEKGGFIESEENLSHEGNCWVGGNAIVYGSSRVSDDAIVDEETMVEDSKINGYAYIHENAVVLDGSIIDGNAEIYGNAIIQCSIISNYARIYGNTKVDTSNIFDYAEIFGTATVSDSTITGYTKIYSDANVISCTCKDYVEILDNLKIENEDLSGYSYNTSKNIINTKYVNYLTDEELAVVLNRLRSSKYVNIINSNNIDIVMLTFIEEPVIYIRKVSELNNLYQIDINFMLDEIHEYKKPLLSYLYVNNPIKVINEIYRVLKVFFLQPKELVYLTQWVA